MTIRNFRRLTLLMLLLFLVSGAEAATVYVADLSGSAEYPSNSSTASGYASVEYDATAHALLLYVTFAGLTSGTTASHIHCCVSPSDSPPTAGVAVTSPFLPGFPLGVTSGTYSHSFDLTDSASFNATFITNSGGTLAGAEAALVAGLDAGYAYLNIHTSNFPAGEIRGFLQPVPILPSLWLFGSGLLGLIGIARRTNAF